MAIVYKYEGGGQITISGREFDCVIEAFQPIWMNMMFYHDLRPIVHAWQALRDSSPQAVFEVPQATLQLFIEACETMGVPITAGVGDGSPVRRDPLPTI